MNQFDENINHIQTTQFETYLAKLILQHNHIYEPVFQKTNQAIKGLIDLNRKDRQFDRALFTIFSTISQLHPGYNSIDDILDKPFDVAVHIEFHKQFFEYLFIRAKQKVALSKPSSVMPLANIAQHLIMNDSTQIEALKMKLRCHDLFSHKGRSRIELDEKARQTTKKLGIISENHTPVELKDHYAVPFEPAQHQFQRNTEGFFSKWLKARNLPFIAGPSGSVEILYCHIMQLDYFTPREMKTYFMGAAAAMVARGHHSFAEVMVITDKLGFSFKDKPTRRELYEQILTREFIECDAYQAFLQEPFIKTYFDSYDKHFSVNENILSDIGDQQPSMMSTS